MGRGAQGTDITACGVRSSETLKDSFKVALETAQFSMGALLEEPEVGLHC